MLAVTKIQAKQNMEDDDTLYEMLLEDNTSPIVMLPEERTIMPPNLKEGPQIRVMEGGAVDSKTKI
ncbi:hypothetical protein Pyn_26103 [Prunus yedoensis var. nudiflora]|uniref:Uncharacterized protein n=1 Tax=Prunus yedoensis var. nudiflora TaxID=2094558 RepID=A0A314XW55_PRUYE|nr:hypothetical protein Pyn_26103 [Prunus yedoensis var. nudiflora]